MILFISDGRLGNQIFQYAFLKTISKDKESIVTINMEQFLEVFEVESLNFKNLSLNKYVKFFIKKILKPFLIFCSKLKLIGYIKQAKDNNSALPYFFEQKGILPIKLVETDFFQSERFFDSKKIDFRIKEKYISQAMEIIGNIPSNMSKVFVHIRRGDYLTEPYLGKIGIALPKSFYLKAIEKVKHEIENPYFIFISDDIDYVESCFADIENKYLSRNNIGVDLALMSLCEYGIAANSSFSWWGAYLMKNRKKVIFPKYWFGWKDKIESHIGIQPEWGEVMDV